MNQFATVNGAPATTEATPFPPLFSPFQPVNTFLPVIRPVVGLTPQEALIGGLTFGAIAPAVAGNLLTLFNVAGAGQLAGQLRALSALTGLAIPPAFLFPPQAPPATAGTIPMLTPQAPMGPHQPIQLQQ